MIHNNMNNDTSDKKIELVIPDFNSDLASLIIELERMRERKLGGTTNASTFFQLKKIFHILESVGSARIEGNNTTVAEYIEAKIDNNKKEQEESILEIENSEKAKDYIYSIKDYNGSIGTYQFEPNGDVSGVQFVFQEAKEGSFVPVQ